MKNKTATPQFYSWDTYITAGALALLGADLKAIDVAVAPMARHQAAPSRTLEERHAHTLAMQHRAWARTARMLGEAYIKAIEEQS